MTVPEIEAACLAGKRLDFTRHALEPAEPSGKRMFYPFGVPVEVRCDTPRVFEMLAEMWEGEKQLVDSPAIRCEVYVEPASKATCPPQPTYQFQRPYFFAIADNNNHYLIDMNTSAVRIALTENTLEHRLYAKYFFLSAPLAAITAKYATPIHAACVSWKGCGVLLCGDSGAGKSTLAYACARAGWTYTSDDACYLLHKDVGASVVVGNSRQFRFRPETAQLFRELNDLRLSPRAAGKPSAELDLDTRPDIHTNRCAHIDAIVFLDRSLSASAHIAGYRKDVARYAMRQTVFGMPHGLRRHYRAIDELLQAPVLKLEYSSLDEAVETLRTFAEHASGGAGCAAAD